MGTAQAHIESLERANLALEVKLAECRSALTSLRADFDALSNAVGAVSRVFVTRCGCAPVAPDEIAGHVDALLTHRNAMAELARDVADFILDHDNELGPDIDRLRDALASSRKGA